MKKIKPTIRFEFNIDDDVPELNYNVPMKEPQKTNKINIHKKRNKKTKDSSINLF